MSERPGYVFVADDFTGASDTLATLARAGLDPRLYLDAPCGAGALPEAFGVATALRAQPPETGVAEIRRIAGALARTGARRLHLKVCSTFDSAPGVGNIARVADAFAEAVGAPWIAIVGGQPSLGRTCVHGNLFATAGDGAVHRLDRHPVMRAHPVTPMAEADLRLHLGAQGWPGIGHVDFTGYAQGAAALAESLETRIGSGETRTLFDVATGADLAVIGAALERLGESRTLLCVGASSVAEAFFGPPPTGAAASAPAGRRGGPVLAFSGSRSSVTAAQVEAATEYRVLPVDPAALVSAEGRQSLAAAAGAQLAKGNHALIVLTAGAGHPHGPPELATAGAHLIRDLCLTAPVGCLAIAGGDTASAAVRTLGVTSLEVLGELDRGAPLLAARGEGAFDGLPMVLKGGQMASHRFFDRLVEIFAA